MRRLLEKTRKITELLQQKGTHEMQFTDLCNVLSQLLGARVCVLSSKGKILGLNDNWVLSVNLGELVDGQLNRILRNAHHTVTNQQGPEFELFVENGQNDFLTIVPIVSAGERLGTLVLRRDTKFEDEDLVVAEYGATVVGMEILRSDREEKDEIVRKEAEVKLAVESLSYSEREAVANILDEIKGREGLIVASKIADRAKITRSVIVNALRKLESAGVIEARSLGMKGTLIKIVNEKILEEF